MGMSISFIAIRKDKLKDAPPGVRNFARDFLIEKEIFGIPCFVGLGTDGSGNDKAQWIEYGKEESTEQYEMGIDPEIIKEAGIFAWFGKHPEIAFEYSLI